MADTIKPFVTPENMSRIIQQWFSNFTEQHIMLTDKNCEDAEVPGIVFSRTEFMDMLRKFDALAEDAKQPTVAAGLSQQAAT